MTNKPKFAVGDVVWIIPLARYGTINAIVGLSYRIENVIWKARDLMLQADYEARQAQIKAEAAAREAERQERHNALVAIEPIRGLFDSDMEFETAFCQWANSFGLDCMPAGMRYWYDRYMLKNRFVFRS